MKNFKWDNFSREFIYKVIYNHKTDKAVRPKIQTDDIDMLIPSMLMIAEAPTRDFVLKYRTEIEFYFLKQYPGLILNITGAPKKANHLTELNYVSQAPMTNSLADLYIKAMLEVGGGEFVAEEYSEFSNKRMVDLKSSIETNISLYDFQQDAVKSLKEHFIDKDNRAGFLVMPTGSGKTRTAVNFLLGDMIAQGYQVIWLTHRHMLIDQPAKTFYDNAPYIKMFNNKKKQFKMTCVSGNHQTIKATEKDDDLMILSVQSTCRSLEYLKTVIAKKVIIVVDEAHHTVAKSYRNTIDFIMKKRKDAKLLGLTATPIRGKDTESRYLMKLFDDSIVYTISMAELIKKGILSEPVFEHIQTNENIEATITLDERKFIKKWKNLPESLVDKVAKSSSRNTLIVNQYLQNKEKYGKTLVFALNGYHAYTLAEEFKKHKVKCAFVYSAHGKEENARVIRKFINNEIDVLININILTEGSDIPDIQTVFLTRPTMSDVLLLQMIGRGMRGTYAGGTKQAYIVDFCDKWETFNSWLNPEWLIDTQIEADAPENGRKQKVNTEFIPWDMVKDIYDAIAFVDGKLNSNISIPYGWYSLWNGSEDVPLIVFEDQYSCYEKLYTDKTTLLKSGKPSIAALKQYYFGGFVTPVKDSDLALFWENIKDNEEKPAFFLFEDRGQIDPYVVAEHIVKEKIFQQDYTEEVFNKYPMAGGIYGTLVKYNEVISQIINHKLFPPSQEAVVEFPIELIPFAIDKPHDLQALTKEVIDEMFGGVFDRLREICWTVKPMKRYFGICYNDGEQIDVKINLLLNSSQVDKEVVKYIIYHELLHRDNMTHNAEFRLVEHKYPNYTELERVLDYQLITQYKFDW